MASLPLGAETAGCGDASVLITLSELSALAQVVVVDLVLAGDNAIVVGLVAAGLPRHQRAKVIMTGIVAATVEAVEGVDDIRNLPGVDEVHVNRPPGSAVDAQEGSPTGHVVKIDGLVDSHQELLAVNEKIVSMLRMTFRQNRSPASRHITPGATERRSSF